MRRRALVLALEIGVAACVAGCGAGSPASDSTLRATLRDRHGSGRLSTGPGEPFVHRTELGPEARPVRQLALFAVLADAHVRDAESPARAPFLARLGPPFQSTFRPQEALTSQVLAASVTALNKLPLQAVVEGGDLIDNDQRNELDQALTAVRGGVVHPDSGRRGYTGIQTASDADPFYYRPDVDAPRHPGLLAAATSPFRSEGLRAPWYPVLGNHDIHVQGELAPTPATNAIAVGSRRLLGLSPEAQAALRLRDPHEMGSVLARGLPGPSTPTPSDPRRAELSPAAVLSRLRATSGHGGGGPLLDFSFDIGGSLRGIVLDTVRREGGAEGVVRPSQLAWLAEQLRGAGRRWVIVFSHHPLPSSVGGHAALNLLDHDPHVLAVVAGHTHHNSIVARHARAPGYWLITTASLVDYPQQARVFRLQQTANGRPVLDTWMLNHARRGLAGTSLELSYLDAQGGRPSGFAGRRSDRNARLFR